VRAQRADDAQHVLIPAAVPGLSGIAAGVGQQGGHDDGRDLRIVVAAQRPPDRLHDVDDGVLRRCEQHRVDGGHVHALGQAPGIGDY
jgi:hypothetical protein